MHAACSCVLISKDQEGRQSMQGVFSSIFVDFLEDESMMV